MDYDNEDIAKKGDVIHLEDFLLYRAELDAINNFNELVYAWSKYSGGKVQEDNMHAQRAVRAALRAYPTLQRLIEKAYDMQLQKEANRY